jgi:hypothetical protein
MARCHMSRKRSNRRLSGEATRHTQRTRESTGRHSSACSRRFDGHNAGKSGRFAEWVRYSSLAPRTDRAEKHEVCHRSRGRHGSSRPRNLHRGFGKKSKAKSRPLQNDVDHPTSFPPFDQPHGACDRASASGTPPESPASTVVAR